MSNDMTASETERLRAWGNELIRVHDLFREDLAVIRNSADERPARSLESTLRAQCVTFCEQLHAHHTMEDNALFPHLRQQHPELADVLDRLQREHVVIARLLDEIESAPDEPGTGLPAELARLSGELESHLDYEEAQLVPVLNRLTSLPDEQIQREEDRLAHTTATLHERLNER